LYPLQLGLPFHNDVEILKPKVGLGPNHIEIDLKKKKKICFMKSITLFMNKISYFLKIKAKETLGHTYAC